MKSDVQFYMDGTLEGRLSQLVAPDSPLKLEKQIEDFYVLHSTDSILDGRFTYSVPDSELMSEDKLHVEAQKTLGFKSGTSLHYSRCSLNLDKIAEFRKITEYMTTNNIPFYMTTTDGYGDETLIIGYNPVTNIKIQNPNFKQVFHNLSV